MRIDLYNSINSGAIGSESAGKASSISQLQDSGSSEDRTTLSSDTTSLSSLVSTAMSSPEVRSDRIASLQQQVQNGTYQIDPDQIAASMIDEHA